MIISRLPYLASVLVDKRFADKNSRMSIPDTLEKPQPLYEVRCLTWGMSNGCVRLLKYARIDNAVRRFRHHPVSDRAAAASNSAIRSFAASSMNPFGQFSICPNLSTRSTWAALAPSLDLSM